MYRSVFAIALLAALTLDSSSARAGRAATIPASQPTALASATQLMVFNLAPAGTYDIRKNGAPSGSLTANPAGALVYEATLTSGDRVEFLLTGIDPVDPARPSGVVASGNTEGCAVVSWNAPAAGEYVTGYSLLWGKSAGAYTDSVTLDGIDIVKNGATWLSTRCGFATGTYAFALRAHNSFDRWSGLSAPSTTSISNQNTQGPVPPTNAKVSETSPGCATVTWSKSGDANVAGYRVYFGTRPRSMGAYTDSIEAGNTASAERCGLAQGTYYFAVRAYTSPGVFSAYSKEVSLTAQGVDVAAPTVSQRAPAAGATNVPLNATIFFIVSDDKSGVDTGSIALTVNGQNRAVTTTPTTGGVAVQCDPGDFAPDTDVAVELAVSDHGTPPNTLVRAWSFHTGTSAVTDNTPPVITAVTPTPGASGVDPRPTIEVLVTDAGLGVDLTSIVMEVNGEGVAYTVAGTPSSTRVSFRPSSAFSVGSPVTVHVSACDRAASANCATPLDLQFSIGAANASDVAGAIVPNGFWAGDQTRPLEIHNLPRSWWVRIFDATGSSVRRHQNTDDGATWTWNFTNDDGRRVAPALYLVRVTDGNGAVQTTGRFLVQSQQ